MCWHIFHFSADDTDCNLYSFAHVQAVTSIGRHVDGLKFDTFQYEYFCINYPLYVDSLKTIIHKLVFWSV